MLASLDATCFGNASVQQLMLAWFGAALFCFGMFHISRGAEGHNCGVLVALCIRGMIPVLVTKVFVCQILCTICLVNLGADVSCEQQRKQNGPLPQFFRMSATALSFPNVSGSLLATAPGSINDFGSSSEPRHLKSKT